ncbi:MAG: shikimate dehydrogenase [Anaerolineae bacterium]|nr:shikimate dehydrogenase [Anaerolineae bacterium]
MDGATKLVGVIGWPVAHSLSPVMHNAAFDALGLNWRYVAMPVRTEDVGAALRGLRALGFQGVNVTVPHKQRVVPHLAGISPEARTLGAVNTLSAGPDGWHGDNTDARGFIRDLIAHGVDVKGKMCLVLGAGGAARAVVYALTAAGGRVAVFNRTHTRALDLVSDLTGLFPGGVLTAHAMAQLGDFVRDGERAPGLIVNTTSVGMWPDAGTSPWPDGLKIPPETVVYDLVYKPLRTRFLEQAESCGARTIDGIGMLVHQGAEALQLWTGQEAPIDVMTGAAREAAASMTESEAANGEKEHQHL